MSAGPGDASRIYRSSDGGATWTLAHTNPEKDGFYDAIAFWDDAKGLVLGDPVDGRFRVRATRDGGATWTIGHGMVMPAALENEGAFAASGTCLFALKGGNDAWFVTGGAKVARVFHTDGSRPHVDRRRHRPRPTATRPRASSRSPSSTPAVATPPAATTSSRQFAGLNGMRTEDGGATWDASAAFGDRLLLRRRPRPRRPQRPRRRRPRRRGRQPRRRPHVDEDAANTPMNAAAFTPPDAGWAVGPKGTAQRFAARP